MIPVSCRTDVTLSREVPYTLDTLSIRKDMKSCKVRINIKKFESIHLYSRNYGFKMFGHCLN